MCTSSDSLFSVFFLFFCLLTLYISRLFNNHLPLFSKIKGFINYSHVMVRYLIAFDVKLWSLTLFNFMDTIMLIFFNLVIIVNIYMLFSHKLSNVSIRTLDAFQELYIRLRLCLFVTHPMMCSSLVDNCNRTTFVRVNDRCVVRLVDTYQMSRWVILDGSHCGCVFVFGIMKSRRMT